MSSKVQAAVETYIRIWSERDADTRRRLIDDCFAADGRIVTRSREICGRAGVVEESAKVMADPELVGIRIISAIDAQGTTFRFRSAVDRRDGKSLEFFDAGQIDDEGRISLILTFAGPLGAAGES